VGVGEVAIIIEVEVERDRVVGRQVDEVGRSDRDDGAEAFDGGRDSDIDRGGGAIDGDAYPYMSASLSASPFCFLIPLTYL
jgi:hypothetical protein